MRGRSSCFIPLLCSLLYASGVAAAPPDAAARARLAAGQSLQVVVEYDVRAVDQAAAQERTRRRLNRDDAAVRTLRAQGYARVKVAVDAAATAPDATRQRDYAGLPLALWRVDTPAALARLQNLPGVRAVHENRVLRPNSVNDLPFIRQPEAATEGATGTGTVVAVIDGGLGNNYLSYSDFGTCTGVDQPGATCRVRYNHNYYSGAQASHETTHGTNVSAIALGVAPGAKLAMYNVFGWFYDPSTQTSVSGAFVSDILDAMDNVLSNYNATSYNVVAVNMSLGDSSTHATYLHRQRLRRRHHCAGGCRHRHGDLGRQQRRQERAGRSGLCTPGRVGGRGVQPVAYAGDLGAARCVHRERW